jgi:hypothetical protein
VIRSLFLVFFLFLPDFAFAFGVDCGCYSADWSLNHNDVTDCNVYTTISAYNDGYASRRAYNNGCYSLAGIDVGMYCHDLHDGTSYDTGLWVLCSDFDCPDLDENGECDPTDPCADESPSPADVCGGIENVTFTDVDTCDYHCENCEDEYQAKLLECADPHLQDALTCNYICDCQDVSAEAETTCPQGYFFDNNDCTYACKDCPDLLADCQNKCSFYGDPTEFSCESSGVSGRAVIDSGGADTCECKDNIVDPDPDPDPDSGDPDDHDPDPDKQPSPDPDPENPYDGDTCATLEAKCPNSCGFICATNSVTGNVIRSECDCSEDPTDPNNPDQPADDLANGWLEEVERNTDRTANNTFDGNGWLKGIKHNTDTQLTLDKDRNEDLGNISENARRSVANQKSIDSSLKEGNSYLKTISEKDFLSGDIVTSGGGVVPTDNIYDLIVVPDPAQPDPAAPDPDNAFSQGLSDYIATGIPLISYLEGTTISLSSSSPVLSMSFWGSPVNIDFSPYEPVINVAGNILFYINIISGFMLIITRVKG